MSLPATIDRVQFIITSSFSSVVLGVILLQRDVTRGQLLILIVMVGIVWNFIARGIKKLIEFSEKQDAELWRQEMMPMEKTVNPTTPGEDVSGGGGEGGGDEAHSGWNNVTLNIINFVAALIVFLGYYTAQGIITESWSSGEGSPSISELVIGILVILIILFSLIYWLKRLKL